MSLSKVVKLADKFAQDQSPEQASKNLQNMEDQQKRQEAEMNIKRDLSAILGFDISHELTFSQFDYLPASNGVSVKYMFSRTVKPRVDAKIAEYKKTNPGYSMPNLMKILLKRYTGSTQVDVIETTP